MSKASAPPLEEIRLVARRPPPQRLPNDERRGGRRGSLRRHAAAAAPERRDTGDEARSSLRKRRPAESSDLPEGSLNWDNIPLDDDERYISLRDVERHPCEEERITSAMNATKNCQRANSDDEHSSDERRSYDMKKKRALYDKRSWCEMAVDHLILGSKWVVDCVFTSCCGSATADTDAADGNKVDRISSWKDDLARVRDILFGETKGVARCDGGSLPDCHCLALRERDRGQSSDEELEVALLLPGCEEGA